MLDKFRDECGVFGIFGHPEAANLTYLGLYALQHRGQESAGIAAADGVRIRAIARRWATSRRSSTATRWPSCPGRWRSATCGTRRPARAAGQRPADCSSTACTGRSADLPQRQPGERRRAARRAGAAGAIFQTNSDTEVVLHLFARSQAERRRGRAWSSRSRRCAARFRSCMMTKDRLIARPRSARLPTAGARPARRAWVVCSETCALDLIGATYVRDVEPGEVVDRRAPAGLRSVKPFAAGALGAVRLRARLFRAARTATCSARASTRCARSLAARWRAKRRVDADVIVPIPDSGVCAAIGYAETVRGADAHGPHPQPLRRAGHSSSRSSRFVTSGSA